MVSSDKNTLFELSNEIGVANWLRKENWVEPFVKWFTATPYGGTIFYS